MAAFEKMINLDITLGIFAVKIILSLVLKIDSNGRDIKIDLIEILIQLSIIRSKSDIFKLLLFI